MASMRFSIVSLLLLVVLVNAAYTSHPSKSDEDQYKSSEDRIKPLQIFNEATVKTLNIRSPHRFSVLLKKLQSLNEDRPHSVPELQVGCGEGFTDTKQQTKSKSIRRKRCAKHIRKRTIDDDDARLGYYPWSHQVVQPVPLQSIAVWQPQPYQINRPYFIPIWGSSGRSPIYFPPQPLKLNPGYPVDNPRCGTLPPKGYLPPSKPQENTQDSKMVVTNRFNEDDYDGPVWDIAEPVVTEKPSTTTTIRPTRKRRPSTTAAPPLVHNNKNLTSGFNSLSVVNENDFVQQQVPASASFAPAIPRPRPSSTTAPPLNTEPSRCVWAIISCCSSGTGEVSYNCFEQLGCTGAFWDTSPCDSEFAKAAIASAINFYNRQ